MGHGRLYTRPPLFYPEKLHSTPVPWQEVALQVPTGAVGAAATGAGAACTDQPLQAGQPFLLQPVPDGAGSKLVWSRNSPRTEEQGDFK